MTAPLQVATWNIFGGRTWDGARVDLDLTLATLRRLDADLVALQEVDRDLPRSGRVDQARALAQALGMAWWFAPALLGAPRDPDGPEGSGGPRGGAPVGREGSGEPRRGAPAGREGSGEPQGGAPVGGGDGARALEPGSGDPGRPAYGIAPLSRLPLGDLNLCWPAVRVLALPGWRPLVHGGTFRNRPGGASWRVQLDHVLVARPGRPHARRARILGGPASDHLAVAVELDWPA